jgi:UDPglucose 6-dehydrogenase
MKISIIGLGYVGLTTGVCLAAMKKSVTCLDIDVDKSNLIREGKSPIYEPFMEEYLLEAEKNGLLEVTTDLNGAIRNSEIIFICVETPSMDGGEIDLTSIKSVTRSLGKELMQKEDYHLIVMKSTVVPCTTEDIILPILEKYSKKKAGIDFGICVNPEFLKEGRAIDDFLNPDRIVIGELDRRSGDLLENLYEGLEAPILRTNLRTAEMIKYASNSFLASKISLINEVGNICKLLGIDVNDVANGIGYDERIGREFLRAGLGFGGSCLPKDVKALIARSKEVGYTPRILEEVIKLNEDQPSMMIGFLKRHIPDLNDKKIGILGLSFKPKTDDVRDSRAIKIVDTLLKEGARIRAYDPKAMENFHRLFPQIKYANVEEVLRCDAILILTEWDEFKDLDYKGKIVIDGRGISKAREAEIYEGICW